MDEMIVLTRAVTRGARRPLVIADMPFGSFQVSDTDAVENAIRFVKEAGADAVKLEGAGPTLTRVGAIVGAGIPVMGHIGLTPQSATMLGGFKAQGRTAEKAAQLLDDARALEAAGCFSIVLEAVPPRSPTRSRGGSRSPRSASAPAPARDGQVLVWHDLLGLYDGQLPALRQALRRPRDHDPRRRIGVRGRRPRAALPRGRPHVRRSRTEELEAFRHAVGPTDGRDEVAALQRAREHGERGHQHAGEQQGATTPRQGSRNVVRRPSATSTSDHAANARPTAVTIVRPFPVSSSPPVVNQSAPYPIAIAGTTTSSDSASGSAAKATICRAIRNGGSTPTAFAPSQSASPSRKYPAAP